MRYGEDRVPLLVETNDNSSAYRREGSVTYVRRDLPKRLRNRMSFGMVKLFIGLIVIFLITISIILYVNSSISTKLDRLNAPTTTKPYRMITAPSRPTRKVHSKQTKKKNELLRRFTTTKAKPILQVIPTTTHRTVTAHINRTQIVSFKGDWQCGTAAISKQVTREMIEKDCPNLLDAVNGCCIAHDQCYDEQLGQHECDSGFCKCLSSVTITTNRKASRCHSEHSPWFCEMVKSFGDSYYENAGLNTTLHTGFIDIFGEEAKVARITKVRQKRV